MPRPGGFKCAGPTLAPPYTTGREPENMTPETQRNLAIGAVVVLTLAVAAAAYQHSQWMKKNCKCGAASAFYGGRGGGANAAFYGAASAFHGSGGYAEPYRCGPSPCASAYPLGAASSPNKGASCCPGGAEAEAFTSDVDHWPTSGTMGNLADTNPYGTYAGHADMYYPTYLEGYAENVYWTRT